MTILDTSALYAVLDRDDETHPGARAEWGVTGSQAPVAAGGRP